MNGFDNPYWDTTIPIQPLEVEEGFEVKSVPSPDAHVQINKVGSDYPRAFALIRVQPGGLVQFLGELYVDANRYFSLSASLVFERNAKGKMVEVDQSNVEENVATSNFCSPVEFTTEGIMDADLPPKESRAWIQEIEDSRLFVLVVYLSILKRAFVRHLTNPNFESCLVHPYDLCFELQERPVKPRKTKKQKLAKVLATFGFDPETEVPHLDVRRAYRKLAVVHHPDRGGDPKEMQKLNKAYALFEKLTGFTGGGHRNACPSYEDIKHDRF